MKRHFARNASMGFYQRAGGERQKVGGQAALRAGSNVCGCDLNFGYIGLTWRRTARRIKRLKEGVLTISPDYSDRDPRLFGALLVERSASGRRGVEVDEERAGEVRPFHSTRS